jgi:predicted nuclease of predicted toxin-antitoxin system
VKLLLDENLSPRLTAALSDLYPGSAHVEDCGLISAPDDHVWRFAAENGYILVTKDSDFSERSVIDGWPPKVIWLRLGNCTTLRVQQALREHAEEIRAFVASETDCCLIVSFPPPKP